MPSPPPLPPPLPQPPQKSGGCLRGCLVTGAILFSACALLGIIGAIISAVQQQTRSQSSGGTQSVSVDATQRQPHNNLKPTIAAVTTPSPTPDLLKRLADDKQTVDRIEQRLRDNRESLKKYYATKDKIEHAQDDLIQLAVFVAIYSSEKAPKQGKGLGERAKSLGAQVEQQRRELYASMMEQIFIKQGMDARVTARGKEKEQLHISYALMSRPLIYQFRNEASLETGARSFGFKKIIFTNGFDSSIGSTWTVDL
jgi:hypothetical protein